MKMDPISAKAKIRIVGNHAQTVTVRSLADQGERLEHTGNYRYELLVTLPVVGDMRLETGWLPLSPEAFSAELRRRSGAL